MGSVYRAVDENLGVDIALKEIFSLRMNTRVNSGWKQ